MSQNPPVRPENTPLFALEDHGEFIMRHIGPRDDQVQRMLAEIGLESLDELVARTIPRSIRIDDPLELGEARSESATLQQLQRIASGTLFSTA